jgi:hypothetical protein
MLPQTLPDATPAEYIQISPETLEVANCYLQLQDIRAVADALELAPDLVSNIMNRREVKAYVDYVFQDLGFNNRVRMRNAMDAILKQKFQEMEEAGTGSNKDIIEIMALSHKMAMDQLDRQIKLEQIRREEKVGPKSQVNVQINNDTPGSNYDRLLSRLMGGGVA